MDAAHREGAAGGQRPLHVPGTVLYIMYCNVLYCNVLFYMQLNTDPMKSKMGVLNVIIKPDITDVTGPRAVQEGGNVRCGHKKWIIDIFYSLYCRIHIST